MTKAKLEVQLQKRQASQPTPMLFGEEIPRRPRRPLPASTITPVDATAVVDVAKEQEEPAEVDDMDEEQAEDDDMDAIDFDPNDLSNKD